MASLQVRHTRTCVLGKAWTKAAPEVLEGCDCTPSYYVVTHADGKPVRELVVIEPRAGSAREQAEKRLARIEFAIEENEYQPPQHETFEQFAARWLEGVRARSTTRESYEDTIEYGNAVFRRKQVSKLATSDVAKLLAHVERVHRERQKPKAGETPRKVSEATLARHLRQLSTILAAAVGEGVLRSVPKLDRSRRPKAVSRKPSYFTNAELARLWPELESRPVYLTLCKLAATTGMRAGELAGLRWPDVRLLDGEIDVRRQWTHGEEVDRPKSRKERVVHLVPAARELLEAWWAETGDAGLVFENETGGHLDASRVRKVLYAAMTRAGFPRVGEGGGARTFHSFRHSFARVALENGTPIQWVKDELGHSTITLTVDLYGSWSQEAARESAAKLEGAFAV